mgnify:CR=1 FL=1|jgi:hypothetical protein
MNQDDYDEFLEHEKFCYHLKSYVKECVQHKVKHKDIMKSLELLVKEYSTIKGLELEGKYYND